MIALYEDILIIDGYTRSLLIDTTRTKSLFIPLLWSKIIKKYNQKKDIIEINYYKKHNLQIQSLMNFLYKNELIWDMKSELKDNFPTLSYNFEKPQIIDKIVCLLSQNNIDDLKIFLKKEPFGYLRTIQLIVTDKNIISKTMIDLLLNYIQFPAKIELMYEEGSINKTDYEKFIPKDFSKYLTLSVLQKDNHPYDQIYNNNKCGNKFLSNFIQLAEAKHGNSYFNKTFFINIDGYIYATYNFNVNNKYSLKEINDNILKAETVLGDNYFTEIWNITKDKIEICKDCELKYICIDKRIPQKKGHFWFYDGYCTYNPYVCKWEEESEYIPVSSCGEYTPSGEFIKDDKFIRHYNSNIWKDY